MLKPHRYGVRKRKIILKLRSRTPSLLQDCASLPALLGLTAESGLNEDEDDVTRKKFAGCGGSNFADQKELWVIIPVASQRFPAWVPASKLLPCVPLPNP